MPTWACDSMGGRLLPAGRDTDESDLPAGFEFSTAGRIVFGPGAFEASLDAVAANAGRLCLITGGDLQRNSRWIELIRNRCDVGLVFSVPHEPTVSLVDSAAADARQAGCDAVLGLGGGSAMDTAKAVAALLTNPPPLNAYLEVIGQGRPLARRPAWMAAVPTTAGTGAEVTRNAVLASPAHRVKVSMRSRLMLPDLAVVDPVLTVDMPPAITAATGMDALTQLVEAYVSRKANPMTDALCVEGLRRCMRSLEAAFRDGRNLAARTDMALASLFSGLALANGGLGAVHGIAGPLGGWIRAPHGALCGRLLPLVFDANLRCLEADPDQAQQRARFAALSRLLAGDPNAAQGQALDKLLGLNRLFSLPALSRYGLTEADLPSVADKALNASSMRGNPVALTHGQIVGILRQALD